MNNEVTESIQKNIFKVAKVIDDFTLVINAGANKNIKKGYKFLLYSIGEEIYDPDTHEPLGRLEIVKGKGKITNVQEQISTLESIETIKAPSKTVVSSLGRYNFFGPSETTTYDGEPQQKPFKDPQSGDFVKYIP